MHWLFKPGEQVSLLLSILLWLWVFFVPDFRPDGGIVFKADSDLGDLEALVATPFLKISLSDMDPVERAFLSHVCKESYASYAELLATKLGMILWSACGGRLPWPPPGVVPRIPH